MKRREFLKVCACGVGVAFTNNVSKNTQASEEPNELIASSVVLVNRYEEDLRRLQVSPPNRINNEINNDWQNYLIQSHPTPAVGEAGATVYRNASTSSLFLETTATELIRNPDYLIGDQSDVRGDRIVALYQSMIEADVYGLYQQEFINVYRDVLQDHGYDGIVATKSAEDIGKVFNLEIWNPVIEEFVKKNENGSPLRAIVLDVSNGDTFLGHVDKYFTFGNFTYQGNAVRNMWLGDVSSELLDISGFEEGFNNAFTVRWRLEEYSDIDITHLEYQRDRMDLSAETLNYGRDLHRSLNNLQIETSMLSELAESEEVTFANGRVLPLSPSSIIAKIMESNDISVMVEPSVTDFVLTLQDESEVLEVGFPISEVNQHTLLYQLRNAGILNSQIISSASEHLIPQGSGIFFVEQITSENDEITRLGVGMIGYVDGELSSLYIDSDNQIHLESDQFSEPVQHMMFDKHGEFIKSRRIILFS